jgi:hypothetical protein
VSISFFRAVASFEFLFLSVGCILLPPFDSKMIEGNSNSKEECLLHLAEFISQLISDIKKFVKKFNCVLSGLNSELSV